MSYLLKKGGGVKSRGPKNRDRSKSKTNKFANVECHYCHLKGHIRKYCCQLKRDMKQWKVKDKKNEMMVKMIELPLPLQISLLFMIVMLLILLTRRPVG